MAKFKPYSRWHVRLKGGKFIVVDHPDNDSCFIKDMFCSRKEASDWAMENEHFTLPKPESRFKVGEVWEFWEKGNHLSDYSGVVQITSVDGSVVEDFNPEHPTARYRWIRDRFAPIDVDICYAGRLTSFTKIKDSI